MGIKKVVEKIKSMISSKKTNNIDEKLDYRKPWVDSAKIIFWYTLLGGLWILLSDRLLNAMVDDHDTLIRIQLIKGWFYVFITAVLFFFIVKHRIQLYFETNETIKKAYGELDDAYQNQINLESQLHQSAFYDSLTDLPNRVLLEQTLNLAISSDSNQSLKIAFIYIDIDNFKHVNDSLGHDAGDRLLKEIAQTLHFESSSSQIISRLGGDEFAIAIIDNIDQQEAYQETVKILEKLKICLVGETKNFHLSMSVGISMYPNNSSSFLELLKNADLALNEAKERGKNQICVFNESMIEKTKKLVEMNNEIRSAINNQEFILHYQPQINLITNQTTGYEALIRWNHPQKGSISPADFIPFAEQSGLISQIDEWVFRQVFIQTKRWIEKRQRNVTVSINLSAETLTQEGFIPFLEKTLKEFELKGSYFEIEITETAVLRDIKVAIDSINKLKGMGFSISLDDFGTGYSSLTYLQKLPINTLKVDREFIPINENSSDNYLILESIISLAHYLGLKVCAEGVETAEQKTMLQKLGCDYAQGYFICRPMTAEKIEMTWMSDFN
jgi:diguanylate cyclase (GGDEF)-like protein